MKGKTMTTETTPNKFKLFGQEWTIRIGTDLELDGDLGLCVTDDNLILLNADQTASSIKHTLAHEVLHAVEQKLHLNLSEQQVDLMALGLLDLFTATPEMLTIFKGVNNGKR
jgi:hypothetical protein|tara:strand:+ start:625 stop:960 length:336 start_codon:yes stop_codon:yes gene_type:complete